MDVSEIVIPADVPGMDWTIPVLHFRGPGAGPRVYLQAALHANERPGTALLHCLCAMLRQAEAEGALLGDVVVVPHANPLGAAQWHFGEMQGRFDLGSRTNFNRDFPRIALSARSDLLTDTERFTAAERLKRELLHRALGADLVLDLHCDDESLHYAYIDHAFWPEAADLAAALGMEAVFLSDGESSAFEEAVAFAWKQTDGGQGAASAGRLSVTLELRGRRDVDPGLAVQDAKGLFAFLTARGVVEDKSGTQVVRAGDYQGPAFPLDTIEMIKAPSAGTVLFHRTIGDRVEKGDLLAVIVTRPGFAESDVDVRAPQTGLVVTRSSARFVRRRDDMMKIACVAPSEVRREAGTLED